MTSHLQLRFARLAPSLLVATALSLAGCATSAPRPPAPISNGRPDAPPPPVVQPEIEVPEIEEEDLEPIKPDNPGYTPSFMQGREPIRASVLLPFSHPNEGVRREAEGMLAGIEMALFDRSGSNILLMPKDTAGSQTKSATAAQTSFSAHCLARMSRLFAHRWITRICRL